MPLEFTLVCSWVLFSNIIRVYCCAYLAPVKHHVFLFGFPSMDTPPTGKKEAERGVMRNVKEAGVV